MAHNVTIGDNVLATNQSTNSTVSAQHQIVQPCYGALGSAQIVTSAYPLPTYDARATSLSSFRRVSAASNDLALVSGAASRLFLVVANNLNAAVRYLHLYDKATAPVIGDTSSIKWTIPLVGSAVGLNIVIPIPGGLYFSLGIGMSLTTTVDGTTGAVSANETVVNLGYATA